MKKVILVLSLIFSGIMYGQVRVGLLKGSSCIPAASLMEEVVSIDGEQLEFEIFSDSASLVPELLTNKIDAGFLPVNVAAKLYNASKNSILCTAVTCEGNISLISKNNGIKDFKDLEGKTVYVAGKQTITDYMFRYLLTKNGITYYDEEVKKEEGVQLNFSKDAANLVQDIISGAIDYAVVPEPYGSAAVITEDSVLKSLNFQKEYKELTRNSNYPLTVMVVSRQFAENKTELLNKFLVQYSEACERTNANPRIAASLCEKYNLGVNAAITAAAIPDLNFVYIPASSAKEEIKALLQIFLDSDAGSIGEKIPEDNFYY